jgi:hypothetical protein
MERQIKCWNLFFDELFCRGRQYKIAAFRYPFNHTKIQFMKTLYKRILAVRNVSSEDFPQGLSILLMIFFLLFGTASLFLLL